MKRFINIPRFFGRRLARVAWFLVPVAFITCILAPTLPAISQVRGLDTSAIERHVEMTREILNEAADVVRESESQRARVVLQRAFELHEQSLVLLADEKVLLARQLSVRARSGAQHAVKLARESFGLEEQARIKLERFQEFHDQLSERVRESDDSQARHFLVEARRQALKAREQFQQHNFQMVLSLIDPAEAMLTRVGRLLFESGDTERLEHEFERTRAMIDRAKENIAEQATAKTGALLVRAEEAFTQARQFQAKGTPLQALHSLRLARRLAGQAASQASGDNIDVGAIRNQIERWDQRAADIAEAISDSNSEQARQEYRQATDHRGRAERLLNADDFKGALRNIKIAHDLLNKAGERAR